MQKSSQIDKSSREEYLGGFHFDQLSKLPIRFSNKTLDRFWIALILSRLFSREKNLILSLLETRILIYPIKKFHFASISL